MDADGSHRRELNGFRLQPAWSPDGRLIAHASGGAIRVMDARGHGDRLIVRNGGRPDWSPDGRSIVFERASNIWLSNLKGRGQRLIVRNGDWPRWSPDGKKLAFERGNDVYVHYLARGVERRLVRNGGTPAWSPDGKRIAFTRDRSVIYVIGADGANRHRVAAGDTPVWSPDNRELAFVGGLDGSAIIRIRIDGTHRRVVFSGPVCCSMPDWSPVPRPDRQSRRAASPYASAGPRSSAEAESEALPEVTQDPLPEHSGRP